MKNRHLFLTIISFLFLIAFCFACETTLIDEQLIQKLLTTHDTINNTEDITLVSSIYSTDAILYHGNRTQDTSDDYLFKNGINEITDFYIWSFDNLDMDYTTIAADIVLAGKNASCTAYLSGIQIDTNTQQILTLTNQLQLWQLEKTEGVWLITEGTIFCDWVEPADSINIVSVSPNSGLVDGDDYDFTVVVEYDLVTKDQGELDIGFNNGSDISKFRMLEEYQIVDQGNGQHTFNVSATAADWGVAGDFQVFVYICEYPHDTPFYTLDVDFMTLTF